MTDLNPDDPHTGNHWKVIFWADSHEIADISRMRSFLLDIVDRIECRPLAPPHMYDVALTVRENGEDPYHDEGGITGVVVLSTSHCAAHSWPKHSGGKIIQGSLGAVVLDVYSCRPFKFRRVLDVIAEHYYESAYIERATDLSESLRPA